MGYDYIVNTRPIIVFYLGVIVKELLFEEAMIIEW